MILIGKNNKTEDFLPIKEMLNRGELPACGQMALKQAKEALIESEGKFRTLVEKIPAITYTATLDEYSTTQYISPQIEPILGFTQEEYKEDINIWDKQLHPDDRNRVLKEVAASHQSNIPFVSEYRMLTKNGSTVWFRDEAVIVKDAAGKPLFLQGLMIDITERKQAGQALRDSEKKLAQAIDGNSIPTFIIDNNHIITHWNKACESLTGFSATEMVGTKKHWLAFYPAERPVLADFIVDGATEEEISGYCEGKHHKSILIEGAYEGENFYPNLGEKGKWLLFTVAPLIDHDGNIIGAIETFQDITECRITEDQLRQAQKMEAVVTLAGGIAHEFNTLMTTVMGNADLALMSTGKDDPLREGLEDIKSAGERAADLTRQIMAFSRKQMRQPKILDLNKNLVNSEKTLKHLITENVELKTIFESSLRTVKMDPTQIEQMVVNLVTNAGDAMPTGGTLTIETANVNLDEDFFKDLAEKEQPGSYVMLSVTDAGSGMDAKTQEHMFDPFYTTREVGKGTGLGLSMVYGIVMQNGGVIKVDSEIGRGSTFKIYLPITEDDPEAEKTDLTREDAPPKVLEAENGEDSLRVSEADIPLLANHFLKRY